MKRKIAWLGVSWLIVAALVLASCGPTAPEGEEEEEEEEVTILSIGETMQTSEMVVTVSEAIITHTYEYYDKISKTTVLKESKRGSPFLIVTVTMKNVSSVQRANEGKERFRVYDHAFSEYFPGLYYGEDVLPAPQYLVAGEEISGKVLFNVQEEVISSLKIAYWDSTKPPAKLAEWEIE